METMSKPNSNIVVPETFPFILKTYAKDAMRTQPYDLLSWSAAYFRCIANDIQPPSKMQFEENTDEMIETRALTKEYLKVLVKQIGKGYFVERTVLQERWKALGLPENNLLSFLNICGMIQWEHVHWLELLSVMAASLSQSIESSIELLCELLTEEAKGGSNSIPVWMFTACYSFLAQLDYNPEKQSKIEIPSTPSIEPQQINAHAFRIELLDEWKSCVGFPNNQNNSVASAHFDRIKTAMTFAEIIQALSEFQSDFDDFANDDEKTEENSDLKWKYEIIRRIGAPWNWVYQFTDHYMPGKKSYNFYECQHKLNATEQFEDMDNFISVPLELPGIESPIPIEKIDQFLKFVNAKGTENDGLFSPQYLTDENCPKMY